MKAAFAFLGLAASVLATGGQDWDKGKGTVITKTTVVDVVYTTLCPVTETIHKPGKTEYTTYTTTSVVWTKIPSVTYETVYGPDKTETAKEVAHVTQTKAFTVVETKTVEGKTVYITSTQTKLVEVYTTDYVYTTTSCPVTSYTTTVEGETRVVTKTNTVLIKVTGAHTVTETRPVTKTAYVDQTLTVPSQETVIAKPTYVTTIGGTKTQIIPGSPTTLATSTPPATSAPATTTPPVPAAGARIGNALALALIAGLFGVVALI